MQRAGQTPHGARPNREEVWDFGSGHVPARCVKPSGRSLEPRSDARPRGMAVQREQSRGQNSAYRSGCQQIRFPGTLAISALRGARLAASVVLVNESGYGHSLCVPRCAGRPHSTSDGFDGMLDSELHYCHDRTEAHRSRLTPRVQLSQPAEVRGECFPKPRLTTNHRVGLLSRGDLLRWSNPSACLGHRSHQFFHSHSARLQSSAPPPQE